MRKRKRGSSKKHNSRNKKWVYYTLPSLLPLIILYASRKPDTYHAFRKFAGWYLRSEHAFIDYCNAFTYGLRYEAKQFGKLTREK
jgi:hypothetical protein